MPRLFRFRWLEKIIEKLVFSRCDLIAGANEDNMRYALENGGAPNRATIFRYGNLIDASHWKQPGLRANADKELAEFGLAHELFVITICRLEPMKYVEDVIRVVAELVRRGYCVKSLIVGDGTFREELECLAATLGVRNEVIFTGYRTQEWIATILPRAIAIISPHMGRALTEAALAGVPIVAYDYDWQREVVIDGQTGYLVAHKDWMGLLRKTESVLTHPGNGKKMGENAREMILKMMDPQRLELHEQNEYIKMFRRFSAERDSAVRVMKRP